MAPFDCACIAGVPYIIGKGPMLPGCSMKDEALPMPAGPGRVMNIMPGCCWGEPAPPAAPAHCQITCAHQHLVMPHTCTPW